MKTGRLPYGIVLLCSLVLFGQQPGTRDIYALHDYNLFQQGLTSESWLSHSETERQNLIELIASTMRDITQNSQSEAVVRMAQKVLDAGDKLRADLTNMAKLEEYVSAVNYFKGMPPEQLSLKKHEIVFEEIPPKVDYIIKNGKILGGTVTYYPQNATWWTGYACQYGSGNDNIDVGQGASETCRGWIKFNTTPTGLPSGCIVTGATLKGYCSKAANGGFGMRVVRMHVDPVPATYSQIMSDIANSQDIIDTYYWVFTSTGGFSLTYSRLDYMLDDMQTKGYHAVGFKEGFEFPEQGWCRISGYSSPNRPSLVVSFYTAPTFPAPPTLSSPANGSTGISFHPALSWNASSGATSYKLEVATNEGFLPVLYSYNPVSTSYTIGATLSSGTTYYWRVSARNDAGYGAPSSTWSFNTTAPPRLSSPGNSSTGISTSPTLSWNASSGATSYKLEIATDYSFSLPMYRAINITSTSHQVTSALSYNTEYFWRVYALDASSNYTNSSEIWRFYTLPATPALYLPGNGSTGVSATPTLMWLGSPEVSYKLEVAENTGFSPTVYSNSQIFSTSQQVTLSSGTTYYWRVFAYGSAWSAPSSAWSFTTLPSVPVLSSPGNSSTGISTTPTFSWNASSGATSYKLEVATNTGFSPTVYSNSNITSTSQQVTLSSGTTYYWRVSAYNGAFSAPSSTWSFTTLPAAPTLSSPGSGSTGISITPTLNWNASAGATSYKLEVATNAGFSPTVYSNSSITSTSQQVTPALSNNTVYYWRVYAFGGAYSAPSLNWSFVTLPAAPALSSPANYSTGIPITPTLFWNASSGAIKYKLEVATNTGFSPTVYSNSNITSCSQQVTLSGNTTYYWRVYAIDYYGASSASSSAWSFSTILASPALSAPANYSTGISTSPALRWYRSGGATSYQLDLSNNNLFSSIAFRDTNITDTVKSIEGLLTDTTYYWRLYAKNIYGKSSSSAVWQFTTRSEIQLAITACLQGFYSGGVIIPDTVTVSLANPSPPYAFLNSAKVTLDTGGRATTHFYNVLTGQYYIVLNHRNSIETWSKPGGESFVKNVNKAYNFCSDSGQAYGENMTKMNGKWCIYSGDVNQDGIIDYSDMAIVDNDSYNFVSGYVSSDVTGDQFVDYSDLSIVDNNSFNFVSVIRPGAIAKPVRPLPKVIERSK